MTFVGFLILLVIAAVTGALAQLLVGYSVGGFLVSAVVGVIGAFIGWWLATQFGLPEILMINVEGQPFPVFWSIIGGIVLVAIVALLTGPRRTVVRTVDRVTEVREVRDEHDVH